MALFEAAIFVLCLSRRPSSAFVSRPVVANLGTATDELREGAIADLGVSGCIEALSLASAANLGDEDDPEFWADARQTRVAAQIANQNAILHFIIETLPFGRCRLARLLNYNTFSFKWLPKAINLWFERTVARGFPHKSEPHWRVENPARHGIPLATVAILFT